MVNYSFQGSKAKTEYTVQNKDGTPGPTKDFTWDIKQNKKV
jgi:hypothetical protein